MNETTSEPISFEQFIDQLFSNQANTENEMKNDYVLVSFVHGDSKQRGVVMGVRYDLPNKIKESKDFPGTLYKALTDHHGQKRIYRYVLVDDIVDFLEDTNSGSKILEKVLTEEQLDRAYAAKPGEVWQDEEGVRYLVLENGYLTTTDGRIWCPACDDMGVLERVARTSDGFTSA